MKNKNYLYLIAGIVALLLGLALFLLFTIKEGNLSLYLLFTSLLPSFVLVGSFFLTKIVKKKFIHFILIPFSVLTIIFVSGIHLFVSSLNNSISSLTDVGKYSRILQLWEEDLIYHFPDEVPGNAENVRFYHQTAFMQGGSAIQLRYESSEAQIEELYDEYSHLSTVTYQGGDKNKHINAEVKAPTTFFYTKVQGRGDSDLSFPSDYEIMVLDEVSTDTGENETYFWNHGDSHGVAISKSRNEIVYWAESW